MKKFFLALALAILALAAFLQSPENKETVLKHMRINHYCGLKDAVKVEFCGEYVKVTDLAGKPRFYKKYIEIKCGAGRQTENTDCQNVGKEECELGAECKR